MKTFPDSINLPAMANGVKYIIVVSREVIDEGIMKDCRAGRIRAPMPQPFSYALMAAWVMAHEPSLRRVAEQLEPAPTISGKRVWIFSEHLRDDE